MPISFGCDCGKRLKAKDEHAGRRTKCPGCGAILTVPDPAPSPEVDPDLGDGLPYALEPSIAPTYPSTFQRNSAPSENPQGPSTFQAWTDPSRSVGGASSRSQPDDEPFLLESASTPLREYVYCLMALALIPLMVSLLDRETISVGDRITKTLEKVPPAERIRIENIRNDQQADDEQIFGLLPEGKLAGAHLARDSRIHWMYGLISAGVFLALMAFMFERESVNPLKLAGVGAFTGTVGIILLLIFQFCASFRFGGRIWGGKVIIIWLILRFIGWSYQSAEDPDSSFWLSAFGFTFGVGLCEEICKAIPIIATYHTGTKLGWRGACLFGLASGVGFGVSEGIMYSGNMYNGIFGADVYFLRFVSCVALHAMWSGAVGVTIYRKREFVETAADIGGFSLTVIQVVAVPMILHGFYDTLLKKDMNELALLVAALTFGWFAFQIETARKFDRERKGRKSADAYA